MTTIVPGKEDVFSRTVNAAKHYRPDREGMPPPLVDVMVDFDGHLPTSHSFMTNPIVDNPFCASKIRKERRRWKEIQAEARRKHKQNLIIYYCDKIRGIVSYYLYLACFKTSRHEPIAGVMHRILVRYREKEGDKDKYIQKLEERLAELEYNNQLHIEARRQNRDRIEELERNSKQTG